jgi:hypothetical protein
MTTTPTPASQPPAPDAAAFSCAKRAADPSNEFAACRKWCGDCENCYCVGCGQCTPSPARSNKDAERAQPVPGLPFADLASGIKKFEADRTAKAQESAPSSEGIATWSERYEADGHAESGEFYMQAEIADLRAELARRATAGNAAPTDVKHGWWGKSPLKSDSAPTDATPAAAPGDLTDEEIIELDCLRLTHEGDEYAAATSSVIEFGRAIERRVLAARAATLDAANWISVDERLPEHNKKRGSFGVEVIVYPQPEKGESTAFYGRRHSDKPEFYKYGSRLTGVTHWMPLPAAPSPVSPVSPVGKKEKE